ncbi:MAG: TIM-barrel domain-containing protein [Planctomycetota bacterium]
MLNLASTISIARTLAAAVAVCAACAPAPAQATRWTVGDGITRYDASFLAKASAPPSHALLVSLPDQTVAPAALPGEPRFIPAANGLEIRVAAPSGTSVYGTGLVPGALERSGRRTTLFNSDVPGWGDANPSLYQSHPWVLLVYPDGSATGVLFDSIERMEIDTTGAAGDAVVVLTDADAVPVYTINKPHPREVVRTLYQLTGTPDMPPLWSLGYHQSRGTYQPETEARRIADELRERRLPSDVIWLDIGYMKGFRLFSWDAVEFANPSLLTADFDAMGFATVASLGGYIRVDPFWDVYQDALAGNHVVTLPDGTTPFVGPLWPGDCVYLDSLNADARDFFAAQVGDFVAGSGVRGIWIDMNEPAVFNDLKTMPGSNVHNADADLGGPGNHARYHNAYGMQLSRAARDGQLLGAPDRRPFTLSRAGHLGGQRYTMNWSGDNRANWYHVDISIQNVLNQGLSGQPWSGPDIGGYLGDIEPGMFSRWLGIGAMLPFSRGHTSGDDSPPKEPWVWGAAAERVNRLALQRRYRLLPHLYTLAHEATTEGLPLVRPLFFADPAAANLRLIDDTFMLGESVVVAAATGPSQAIGRPPLDEPIARFGFPEIDATNAPSDICEPDLPQLYLRPGHIAPFHDRILQHTADNYGDAFGLLINLDNTGDAAGRLYEDAGDGPSYQTGDFLLTTYRATRTGTTITLEVEAESGDRPRPAGRELTLRILLGDDLEHRVRVPEPTPGNPTIIGNVPLETRDLVVCTPDAPAIADGEQVPAAFTAPQADALQTQPTTMGDNQNELNRLLATVENGVLRVGITGNLSENAAFTLLLDAAPDGAETISTAGAPNRPDPVRLLDGATMDPGFTPESLLHAVVNDDRLEVSLYQGLGTASATRLDLGSTPINAGRGSLVSPVQWSGAAVLAGYTDTNTAGVTASDAADAATPTTGLEFELPLSVIGAGGTCGEIRLFALLSLDFGWVGNQLLPASDAPIGLLGTAPDLTLVAGEQFAQVGSPFIDLAAPVGALDFFDLLEYLNLFSDGDPSADLAAPFQSLDFFDVLEALAQFDTCG